MGISEKMGLIKSNLIIGTTSLASYMAFPTMVRADGGFLDNIKIGENGSIEGIANSNTVEQGNELVNKLKDILGVVQGVAIVLCVIFLVVAGAQLAMSSGNSQKRAQAYEAIKNCAVGAGITGAAALVIQMAYSFLL